MKKIFFFSLLFVAFLWLIVFCLEKNPHDFNENQCVICHQGDPSSTLSLGQSSPTLACNNCHAAILESGFMHPYDVRPDKVVIPMDMPLSPNGLIVCTTCHDVHAGNMDPLSEKTYFLRRQLRGREFCLICHSQSGLSGTMGHEFALGEAHFQSEYISSSYGQEIDETSKNCISCHDGSYASSVSISTGVWQHSSDYIGDGMGRKHPIGIDYEQARLRYGRKTDLRPVEQVDQRIQFFEGKIGCGSCHDPYSHLDNDLVMANQHSALCFACHMLDQ
ncbi:MAG: hypothetical protein KQH63_15315 [Desulfobulbaceae bacterium]|nr:hypothetical protein [Desulfobulbaceae bacterium]